MSLKLFIRNVHRNSDLLAADDNVMIFIHFIDFGLSC